MNFLKINRHLRFLEISGENTYILKYIKLLCDPLCGSGFLKICENAILFDSFTKEIAIQNNLLRRFNSFKLNGGNGD